MATWPRAWSCDAVGSCALTACATGAWVETVVVGLVSALVFVFVVVQGASPGAAVVHTAIAAAAATMPRIKPVGLCDALRPAARRFAALREFLEAMPPFYHQRSPASRVGARARLLAMPADGALDEQVTLAPGPVESAWPATNSLW